MEPPQKPWTRHARWQADESIFDRRTNDRPLSVETRLRVSARPFGGATEPLVLAGEPALEDLGARPPQHGAEQQIGWVEVLDPLVGSEHDVELSGVLDHPFEREGAAGGGDECARLGDLRLRGEHPPLEAPRVLGMVCEDPTDRAAAEAGEEE